MLWVEKVEYSVPLVLMEEVPNHWKTEGSEEASSQKIIKRGACYKKEREPQPKEDHRCTQVRLSQHQSHGQKDHEKGGQQNTWFGHLVKIYIMKIAR